jgi:hypothetical protein
MVEMSMEELKAELDKAMQEKARIIKDNIENMHQQHRQLSELREKAAKDSDDSFKLGAVVGGVCFGIVGMIIGSLLFGGSDDSNPVFVVLSDPGMRAS